MDTRQSTDTKLPEPPIDHLPYDVLHIIFLLCLTNNKQPFAVIASHVCRKWRFFSLEAKTLWTEINFRTPGSQPKLLWEVQTQSISRSGDLPLDISIFLQDYPGKISIKTIRSILRIVWPQAHRLRKLVAWFAQNEALRILCKELQTTTLSILVSLDVHGPEIRKGWKGPVLLQTMPTLQDIVIKDILVDYTSGVFATLRTMTLYDPYFAHILEAEEWGTLVYHILVRSPHLTHLKLVCPRFGYSDPVNFPNMPLPNPNSILIHQHISEICISQVRPGFFDTLLPWVRLPVFQAFKTGSGTHWTYNPNVLPIVAEHNPFPSIIEFTIWLDFASPHHTSFLWTALGRMPKIQYLGLEHLEVGSGGFERITEVCPALTHLRLVQCVGLTQTMLSNVLKERAENPGVAGLEFLDLHNCAVESDEEFLALLRSLWGINVAVWRRASI